MLKKVRRDIPVFVHPNSFVDRYSVTPDQRTPIGIPFAQNFIEATGGAWHKTTTPTEVVPGLWFSGTIPRVTDFEIGDLRLDITGEGGIGEIR